jgi:hypothetical protein
LGLLDRKFKEIDMIKKAAAAIFVLASVFAPAAIAAPSDADCKAMWAKADSNKDGSLADSEVKKFMDAIKASGKKYDSNADGKLDQAEFLKACKDGVFASIK